MTPMNRPLARRVAAALAMAALSATAHGAGATLFSDRGAFTAALGGATTYTQDFEGYSSGANLYGVEFLPGVSATTNLDRLWAISTAGDIAMFSVWRDYASSLYDIQVTGGWRAFGFEIESFDPSTPGPGLLNIQFADGDSRLLEIYPTNPNEDTPLFFGVVADRAVTRITWTEGPESAANGGGCCEETALDDFIVASPVPEPSTYGLMAAGLAMVGALAARRRPLQG